MATEVNFLQSRKEVFLSLSLTALIDDVNGLEPYILQWQVICYTGSNNFSTTPQHNFEAHKVDFFSDVNGHFLGSNCHLAWKDISNKWLKAPGTLQGNCMESTAMSYILFSFLVLINIRSLTLAIGKTVSQ